VFQRIASCVFNTAIVVANDGGQRMTGWRWSQGSESHWNHRSVNRTQSHQTRDLSVERVAVKPFL